MTAVEQASVLARAWEAGAFADLVERWSRVRELQVASATDAQLAEAVAVSSETVGRILDLLGEPVRKGTVGAISFSPGARAMVSALALWRLEEK